MPGDKHDLLAGNVVGRRDRLFRVTRVICSPSAAFEPVIGPTTAIGIFCALASPAAAANTAAKITDWPKRFMNPPLAPCSN